MPPLSQPLAGKQHDGQTPGLRHHHHAMALLRHNAHRSASSRAPHADLDTFHLSQLCDAASSQQVRQTASGTTEDYPPQTHRKRESLRGPPGRLLTTRPSLLIGPAGRLAIAAVVDTA